MAGEAQVQLIIAIIGFAILWTGSVVSVVLWLTGKFRKLEILIYTEINNHKDEDADKFGNHSTRIQRLELRNFGFTHSGIDQGPPPVSSQQ